jgi:hypothetical protein
VFDVNVRSFLRRTFDLVGASVGIVALAPLFVSVAIAVKLESRGPVFLKYPGLSVQGSIFSRFKFRSQDQNGDVTRVGLFLRRLSIDELPQLFNVLAGQMSLFGGPPLGPDDAGEYGSAALRLVAKPGLSGAVVASRRMQLAQARRPSPEPTKRADIIDRGKALHLLGESVRDIGVLVLVFAPLDAYFQTERPETWILVLIEGGALCFVGIGIVLESLTVEPRK